MSNRFAKSLAAAVAVATLAVPAAQASQGADDPVGHDTKPATIAAAPSAAKPVKKARNVRHRHGNRHGRKAARRADDNSTRRQGRGADDNQPRGNGADDAPNHG